MSSNSAKRKRLNLEEKYNVSLWIKRNNGSIDEIIRGFGVKSTLEKKLKKNADWITSQAMCLVIGQAFVYISYPPNTTSTIQPCDQGIINSLKGHYRKRIVDLKTLIP